MATALVTQIAYAVQTLFDPAGTAGRLVDLGKLANYGLLTNFTPGYLFTTGVNGAWYDPSDINLTWRRNLLTYSEQFDNAAWSKFRSTVSVNAAVAPDGTMSADKIVATNVLGSHGLGQAVGALPTTVSVYLKAGEYSFAAIGFNNVTPSVLTDSVFNITTGQIVSIGSDVASYSVTDVGNGWFRYSCQPSATATFSQMRVAVMADSTTISYTGDGTSGIYIWGAQLELGSTATPYQRITDGIQDYLQYQAQPVLYQDAAGTTPVTGVEQPVGLMLDKSKGLVLGPELVTNGDFSAGITGWTPGNAGQSVLTWEAGKIRISRVNSGDTYPNARTPLTGLTVGRTYKIVSTTNNPFGIEAYHSIAGISASLVRTTAALRTMECVFTATATTHSLDVGIWSASGAVGQYVEFDNISVRELPGNHAFNSSGNSANFPVLSARYNLLTKTEDFSDAAWATLGTVTRTPNYAVAPDGTTTAQRVVFSQNSSSDQFFQVVSVTSTTYSQGVWIKVPSGSALIKFGFYDGAIKTSALTLTTTWQYFTATQLLTAGAGARLMWLYPDGAGYATEIYVWHPDVRVSNDALNQPAYQRVNTSTDYDTVGFKPYLRFNGTNQWLQTNSIDFTYGDKMFVSAGVRKIDDTVRVIYEFGTSTDVGNGGFVLHVQSSPVGYRYAHSGNTAGLGQDDFSIFAAPLTNVITTISDLSGLTVSDELSVRVNGAVPTQSKVGTASTGVFGNRQLYIGARAGSSFWFNGRLYGLVVAGKQASAAEITSTETYLNQKTGAY